MHTERTIANDKPVLTDADRKLLDGLNARLTSARDAVGVNQVRLFDAFREQLIVDLADFSAALQLAANRATAEFEARLESKGIQKILGKLATVESAADHPKNYSKTIPDARKPLPPREFGAAFEAAGRTERRPPVTSASADTTIGNSGLSRMLMALAQRSQGLTRSQLGLRAMVSTKGGSFNTYLSKARVNGWVDTSGARIRITEAGLAALGSYEPLPEGCALLEHYLRELGSSGAGRMLQAVAGVYPKTLTRAELSERSNVSAEGGSFNTYLSKLRTLELVEGKTELRASQELFD